MLTTWDTKKYDTYHHYVSQYGEDLIQSLNPKRGERILDVGCGTGYLTHLMSQTGAFVVGIDQSSDMIEKAREAYPKLRFQISDIRKLSVPKPCDAILSNACLHWVKEADEAITAIDWALRSGGRFVAEFGGLGNCKTIIGAIEAVLSELGYSESWKNPWFFPSLGEYVCLLEKQGFWVQKGFLFDRFTRWDKAGEDGLKEWLTMFVVPDFKEIPEEQYDLIITKIEDLCRATLYKDQIWHGDYVRLRIVAVKK